MNDRARLFGRHRRTLLAVGAILLAGSASALAPPPEVLGAAQGESRSFAAFASAAIVALAILPYLIWRGAVRPITSIALAGVALALGVGSFGVNGYADRVCTARYADTTVMIGTDLTSLGEAYRRENPDLSSEDLLFDAAGVPERIWTQRSIGRCKALVSGTYFLWIPFLVVCLLAAAQAAPTTILSPIGWRATVQQVGTEVAPQYDVFVSYRHEGVDKTFATELVSALEADGYRVAIDERDFPANASFLEEMERCIRESRFTVAVVSSRYLESGNTREEAVICKVLDMGDRKRRLIPLIIEPVSMPAWLYGIVGVDVTKRDPLVDPFVKLRATLGAPRAGGDRGLQT
jgi:hypothetical protein